MKYGLGYIRDAAHKRTQRDARHLAAKLGGPIPSTISLRGFEELCFDQWQSSGCTGHATAMAIAMALRAKGAPLGWVPSPKGLYTVGRCIGRGSPTVALSDTGAMLADVMTGTGIYGIEPIGVLAPGHNTDVTPANVNVEPNLLELERAGHTLIVGEYRIDERGGDVVQQACAILAQNIPIVVGGYVDTAYEQFVAGGSPVTAPNEADPNGGGHAHVLTGYWTNADGTIDFDDLTSWGGGFGDSGHVRVTSGFVRALWDLYPMTVRAA